MEAKANKEIWDELLFGATSDSDPIPRLTQILRDRGYIVQRPERADLPVDVERGGAWNEPPYRLSLYAMVKVGDRKLGSEYQIDVSQNNMPARAFVSVLASKFTKAIMEEIEPQLAIQCEQQLKLAQEEMK
jgi:predicted component of type VI protein secretion system